MEVVSIGDPKALTELLAMRPAVLLVRVRERIVGRAAFDSRVPERPFVEAAQSAGYNSIVVERGGGEPFHGWIGPGDRWVDIRLVATTPSSSAVGPSHRTFATPEAVAIGQLVRQYREWVTSGQNEQCFKDWIRRFRTGTHPEASDASSLFWYHGLAAIAGLRDGRADASDIAIAAGLAEESIDNSVPEQVAMAIEIRILYGE